MFPTTVLLRLTILLTFTGHLLSCTTHRHLLHQPINLDLPPSLSPQFQPQNHYPKYPFSSSPSFSSPPVINDYNQPFFPIYPSPPPPPPSSDALLTFPANISSLIFPSSKKPISRKLIAVVISASLLAVGLIAAVTIFLYHRKITTTKSNNTKFPRSDSVRLYPSNTPSSSDGPLPPGDGGVSTNSSTEFLYLGTLVNSRGGGVSGSAAPYQKLGSPELRPLPPLPRQNPYTSGEMNTCVTIDKDGDEFFSPRGSYSVDKVLKPDNFSFSNSGTRSDTDSLSSSLTNSPVSNSMLPLNSNPRKGQFKEAPTRPAQPPPPPVFPNMVSGPPPFLIPTRLDDEFSKPRLKPLYWDKVRPDFSRATVWDQLQSSSFQLNEEMIQTLFMVNASNLTPKDKAQYSVLPMPDNNENRVLDPKKSQNIAIWLRALNVTVDEVCQGISDGNIETLGTELLESLLKMAPAKEEERKLKEFSDESPSKLGPAEKFLKAVLDVPFAYERADAMLYIANFDSEIEYLQMSFKTLEIACEELKNNRIFLKLLEAVLKTGNRMNIGTNRGNAHAFQLDTLLKLVDVRGADGKTTLLHFVVQEIIKAEGSRISNKSTDFHDEEVIELRKHGLQVVSGLIEELANVKKAASMDFDGIRNEVSKLASGIAKIKQVLVKVSEENMLSMNKGKFCESGNGFLRRAVENIVKIQEHEKEVLCRVKEITVYFHGNSTKEEAHPLRVFTVVSDFLSVLDQVCKEVGKINEKRTHLVTYTPQFVASVFNDGKWDYDSSDDDNSSSSS